MYERALGVGEIDKLMLRAARVAAASQFDPNAEIPDEPDPTAPREPGAVDKAVKLGKQVGPQVSKAAGKLGQKALDLGKTVMSKKPSQEPNLRKDQYGRIEPTLGTPVPRNMPNLVKPTEPSNAKFVPSKKAPKMKTKKRPVTRYT